MGKVYRKQTGLNVVSGLVKAIEPAQNGAKKVTITVSERNTQTKEWTEKDIHVTSNAVDDAVALGVIATAAGYQWGADNIMATYIAAGPHVENVDDVEILSGLVNKAIYKSEKNEDGTPKLTRNGAPRKPHFDISIIVPDDAGHRVVHFVKVYNFNKVENGKPTNIERMQKRFADFKDRDTTPTECTIVTSPGAARTWESEFNGKIYQNYCCDHMGMFSLDLNPLYERETPQPTPTQPERPSLNQIENEAPFSTNQTQPPVIEDDEVFS